MQHESPTHIHWYFQKDRKTWNICDPDSLMPMDMHPLHFIEISRQALSTNPFVTPLNAAIVWRMGIFSLWMGMDDLKAWRLFPGQLRNRQIIFEQVWRHPWKVLFWNIVQLPAIASCLLRLKLRQWRERKRQPPGGSKSPSH